MLPQVPVPFPWFGGKTRAAPLIWEALGDVRTYIEPFAGGLGALLGRPANHKPSREYINDIDDFLVNFWRAAKHDPEGVAHYANNPVFAADLTARHLWLVNQSDRIARVHGDPDYYDAKVAGWWLWGIKLWIGPNWCRKGSGPWQVKDGVMIQGEGGVVRRQKPQNSVTHQTIPSLVSNIEILAERLRSVVVYAGDWEGVLAPSFFHGTTGILLDPPYPQDWGTSDEQFYRNNVQSVANDVKEWAINALDSRPDLRIVLCGYEGGYDMPSDWRVVEWEANGGYGNQGASNDNRRRERLWLSPGCLNTSNSLDWF